MRQIKTSLETLALATIAAAIIGGLAHTASPAPSQAAAAPAPCEHPECLAPRHRRMTGRAFSAVRLKPGWDTLIEPPIIRCRHLRRATP